MTTGNILRYGATGQMFRHPDSGQLLRKVNIYKISGTLTGATDVLFEFSDSFIYGAQTHTEHMDISASFSGITEYAPFGDPWGFNIPFSYTVSGTSNLPDMYHNHGTFLGTMLFHCGLSGPNIECFVFVPKTGDISTGLYAQYRMRQDLTPVPATNPMGTFAISGAFTLQPLGAVGYDLTRTLQTSTLTGSVTIEGLN